MKGKMIVFLKSFILAFVCAIALEFFDLITVSQMFNIALPGIFLFISFGMLARHRYKEEEKKDKEKKGRK